MRQRDVKGGEQILVALFNALPAHLHGALSELRTVMKLVGVARESTTFLLQGLSWDANPDAGLCCAIRG